jgi:hypothetical protein
MWCSVCGRSHCCRVQKRIGSARCRPVSVIVGCGPCSLRVGDCSNLVHPDLGQVLLVMVFGHVVSGAGLRVRRRSFMRLVVWRHVLRVMFRCWLGATWSEVGVVGD